MRWISRIGPLWTLAIVAVVAIVVTPIAWLVAHPCVRYGAPRTCVGMYCTMYGSTGNCMVWMPYEYECRNCLERE